MTGPQWIVDPAVEAYAEAHSTPLPAYLAAAAERTRDELGPASRMMIGGLGARLLGMLVTAGRARRVLEIGTLSGFSALAMAAALPDDGTLITCEVNPRHAEVAAANVAASPYAGRVEIRIGPAMETIASLTGVFELIFIDADKSGYPGYYEACLPLLSRHGIMAFDNTLAGGEVIHRAAPGSRAWTAQEFNDRLAADPRIVCLQLPVRDGVTLVRWR